MQPPDFPVARHSAENFNLPLAHGLGAIFMNPTECDPAANVTPAKERIVRPIVDLAAPRALLRQMLAASVNFGDVRHVSYGEGGDRANHEPDRLVVVA